MDLWGHQDHMRLTMAIWGHQDLMRFTMAIWGHQDLMRFTMAIRDHQDHGPIGSHPGLDLKLSPPPQPARRRHQR